MRRCKSRQRHVKCDETRPLCRRCQSAHRQCVFPVRSLEKPSNHVLVKTHDPTRSTDSLDSYAHKCLGFFESVTLPAFDASEPSPLWASLRDSLSEDRSLYRIAIALGHEDLMAVKDTQRADVVPDAAELYTIAVRSLRERIARIQDLSETSTVFAVVLGCTLLVILEFFRRSFGELNIHLQHGFRIASQAMRPDGNGGGENGTTLMLIGECLRLLKRFSIAVALFNPLLPQHDGHETASVDTGNDALRDPDFFTTAFTPCTSRDDDQLIKDEMEDLVLELIHTTISRRRPRMSGHSDATMDGDQRDRGSLNFAVSLPQDIVLRERVASFRKRHVRLAAAIEKKCSITVPPPRRRQLLINKATSMVIGVYIQCRWSGYQCNYDMAFGRLVEIVDLIQEALDARRPPETIMTRTSAFSIGLGTIAPLFYVALMCRERLTRRRAVALMGKCPKQDGPWNTQLAQQICTAIIEHEERKSREESAGCGLTGYIPEHCRVAYYYYRPLTTKEPSCSSESLRVFHKTFGTGMRYSSEDLKLGPTEARHIFDAS